MNNRNNDNKFFTTAILAGIGAGALYWLTRSRNINVITTEENENDIQVVSNLADFRTAFSRLKR